MKTSPISALTLLAKKGESFYPEPFSHQVSGRTKRKLGNEFGLTNFGVNLTQLEPGSVSALLHSHSKQDEFIYILQGSPTLICSVGEFELRPGDCMGFPAGTGFTHQLINRSEALVTYLEIGDRTAGDEVDYPEDDLRVTVTADGIPIFLHKDGSPYAT